MMDLKDIILLVVPILMNGFFIFVFQAWVSNKISQKKREREFKYNVMKQYHEILQLINNSCNEIIKESYNTEDFSCEFLSVVDGIWKAKEYMDSNLFDLKSVKETYLRIERSWNRISSLSTKQDSMEKAKFNTELSILFDDFHEVLVCSIKEVRKEMSNLL